MPLPHSSLASRGCLHDNSMPSDCPSRPASMCRPAPSLCVLANNFMLCLHLQHPPDPFPHSPSLTLVPQHLAASTFVEMAVADQSHVEDERHVTLVWSTFLAAHDRETWSRCPRLPVLLLLCWLRSISWSPPKILVLLHFFRYGSGAHGYSCLFVLFRTCSCGRGVLAD